jgi:O-antigen/teichoic acid export membrane protein
VTREEAEGTGQDAPGVIPQSASLAPVDILDTPSAGRKVIYGGVLRTAGYAVGLLAGLLSAALLTRHLGVVDWGRYVTVSSLLAIVGGLSEAGMSSIGVREYSVLSGNERDRLMANLLGLRLAVTVGATILAIAFTVAARYELALVLGTALGGLALVLTMAQQMYGVPLGATLRLGWVSALDLLRQVVTAGLIVLLVLAGAGLLPFFAASLPVALLILILTLGLVRGQVPFRPAFDRAEWGRVLRLTVAYAAAAAIGTIYVSVTVVLISLVGSQRETGYYSASFRVFSVLAVIPLLLVSSAFPVLARAARDDRERLDYARKRLLDVSLIFGIWMALALVFGASPAIHVIAGSDFDPAIAVLRIQGLALIASFVGVTLGFVLLSLRLHRELLYANAVALGISILLTLTLTPTFGARGTAIASVTGETCLAICYAIALSHAGVGLAISGRVGVGVVAAVGAAAALLATPLRGIPLVVAGTVVYFGVLTAAGGMPRELWEALRFARPQASGNA